MIGCLAAVPVLFIADPTLAAAVAVALVLLISGAHHFDGLLDLGDGLMAHGDKEKRVRALTDRQVGAGGVAAGIVTTLLLFAGLQASASIAAAIIAGEVCAKFSMVFLTAYGEPFREGIHSYLHQSARPYFPVLAGTPLPPPLPPAACTGEDRWRAGCDGPLPGRPAPPCPAPLWRGQRGCCWRFERDNPGAGYRCPRAPVKAGGNNPTLNTLISLSMF